MAADLVQVQVRIPRQLHQELTDAAAERQVGKNRLIVAALERYLSHLTPVEEFVD